MAVLGLRRDLGILAFALAVVSQRAGARFLGGTNGDETGQDVSAVLAQPDPAKADFQPLKLLAEPEIIWLQCKEVEVLGTVCVAVYIDPNTMPSALGVDITMRNRTFSLPLLKAHACLDDKLLLELLLHDPQLAPFAAQIKALIEAESVFGSVVVSACVNLTKLVIVVNMVDKVADVSACPVLRLRLGCIRHKCLLSKDKAYDCFDKQVPLPLVVQ